MFRSSLIVRRIPFVGSKFFSTLPKVPTLNNSIGLRSGLPSTTSPFCREMSSLLLNNKPEFISTNLPLNIHIPKSFEGMEINEHEEKDTMYMDSVLRKRRLKMKKHKLRKRRRAQRSLKKRLGKL